jgi:hypothetical protein
MINHNGPLVRITPGRQRSECPDSNVRISLFILISGPFDSFDGFSMERKCDLQGLSFATIALNRMIPF